MIRQAATAAARAPSAHAAADVDRFLAEALDGVADGMPADYVALRLYAALGALQEPGSSTPRP